MPRLKDSQHIRQRSEVGNEGKEGPKKSVKQECPQADKRAEPCNGKSITQKNKKTKVTKEKCLEHYAVASTGMIEQGTKRTKQYLYRDSNQPIQSENRTF